MRRFPRILFGFAKVLLLALSAATVALWAWSYFSGAGLSYRSVRPDPRRADEYSLRSDRGRVRVQHVVWTFETAEGVQLFVDNMPVMVGPAGWSTERGVPVRFELPNRDTMTKVGFYHSTSHFEQRGRRVRPIVTSVGMCTIDSRLVGFPHWFAALLLGLPGVPPIFRACRRWAHRPEGRCPACGYDLRATPDRCPECGAFAPQPARPGGAGG